MFGILQDNVDGAKVTRRLLALTRTRLIVIYISLSAGCPKNIPYSEDYNSGIYWVRIMKLVSFERVDSELLFPCHNFVC